METTDEKAAAMPAPEPGGQRNYLRQGWLVLVLALVFGALLAAVQIALGPAIAANKRNETLSKVPELVWGPALAAKMAAQNQALEIDTRTVPVTRGGKTTYYRVFGADWNGQPAGWVVKADGQGYADRIELLFGLSPDLAKITGLFVLDQKETPGLGNKIASDPWRGQFAGKPTDRRLAVVKSGAAKPHQIDAITGATISSRSVTAIVNRAVADLKAQLADDSRKAAP